MRNVLTVILLLLLTVGITFAGSNDRWSITVKDSQTVVIYEDCKVLEENAESITFITGDRKIYRYYFINYNIVLEQDD